MGLWSLITGAGKTGEAIDLGLKAGESVLSGLDAMVYTSEEKAIDAAKAASENIVQIKELAKMRQSESGASAITRRLAMFIVLGNFTIFAITALVFVATGEKDTAKNIIELALALKIGWLAATVVVSIFGYYTMTRTAKKK